MYANLYIILSIWSPAALFVLRVVLGAIFVAHGWPKIKNIRQTQINFSSMGFRPGAVWGTLITLLEFVGGLAVILGILTQPLAILFAVEMLVATLWKIKQGKGFVDGYEFDLLLLAAALVLITLGSGAAYSLGALLS
ncbi:MAG: DoxX family protein [Patescibacteria group bacterium]|nr:DoxX family protein [Patescibacteria group bacterium]MCL5224275.1 DoxX family protein [Patescibacteria group bacterium]